MNAQKPHQPPCTRLLRWFRNAMLLFYFFAAFQFLDVISWGTYNIPLVALVGVGVALLPGLLFIVFGIVLGIVLGWIVALMRYCKRRLIALSA